MKKMIMALIAGISFVAIGLIILMVYVINNGGFQRVTEEGAQTVSGNMSLTDTKTISLADIDTVNIKYYSDDIVFYTGDSEELIVKEYKNYTPHKNQMTTVSNSNHTVTIKGYHRIGLSSFGMYKSRVEVYLPEKFADILSVSTSSGDIRSDITFNLPHFSATCSSGDINLTSVNADDISLNASSGDIDLQSASGRAHAVASSGDINIGGLNGSGSFTSSSGDVSLAMTELRGDLDMVASSGDITLAVPENMSFHFDANVSSGDIRVGVNNSLTFDNRKKHASGDIGNSPDYNVHMEASSGDVQVVNN